MEKEERGKGFRIVEAEVSINKYRVNMQFSVSMGCLTVRGTDKTELVTITLGFFQSS